MRLFKRIAETLTRIASALWYSQPNPGLCFAVVRSTSGARRHPRGAHRVVPR